MAKLYFSYSAMNAGKSTLLLQAAHNYTERELIPYLLKPAFDDRSGSTMITSRIGISKSADTFTNTEDLLDKIETRIQDGTVDCVFVDEAQFLSVDQVWQLARVADDLSIPVLTYGLRTDFKGELFPGSQTLLAIADVLREIRTVDHTGKKAIMTLRLDEHGDALRDGPQNQIGGNESYVSVCRKEWRKAMER